jgi:hypothetical protein
MAEKIATYEAKDLALHPSNIGSQAAQTAARRINSASEESARAIREVAENQEQVDRAMGQTQAEFLRFEALEQRTGAVGVKYGGGLKDMFQLGGGGREPNYAALNRAAELQEGSLRIARAGRQVVAAQSPVSETTDNGVTVLRGGGGDKSDVEHGVTVLRGGGGVPAPITPTIEGAGGDQPNVNSPFWQTHDKLPPYGSSVNQSNFQRSFDTPLPGSSGWEQGYGGYDPNSKENEGYQSGTIQMAPLGAPIGAKHPDPVFGNSTSSDLWPAVKNAAGNPVPVPGTETTAPGTVPYQNVPVAGPMGINNPASYQPPQIANQPTDPSQNANAPPLWGQLVTGQ